MKFEKRQFSKRFPAVECALFVVHEPDHKSLHTYTPTFKCGAEYELRGTAAAIILPDGRFWVGVCLCSPSDQFVKVTGRNKAIGRAFQKRSHFADGAIKITDEALAMKLEINSLKTILERNITQAKKRALAR